ncbi:MAG: alanine:cation symporter family protein [Chlamydiia bacterium]|nr:alanine:cation symporter family protein [Bdellovibrionales bacterium]MCB1109253.1 alanine:cation symporter family protein [Chlamydiia bacterium]
MPKSICKVWGHLLSFSIFLFLPLIAMAQEAPEPSGILDKIDGFVGEYIVSYIAAVLFFPVPFIQLPLVLFVMVSGGLFFTFRYGFVNIRLFKHSIDVIKGKFDNPKDKGEITHFQALTSALSATVGLGNIAGVAVAIQLGGPGAVLWLWVVAFFGMSMKFSSCTFSQLYRQFDSEGKVLGGPMVYLSKGFSEFGLPGLGKFLGALFAVLCIFGSFGGGNLFQANQTYELLAGQIPSLRGDVMALIVGIVLAFFAGIVLIGGIKRIATVTSKMVPAMTVFYVTSCLIIIVGNYERIPEMLASIFSQAFNPEAIYTGGFLGVLIQGVKRASFSNEAGVGSAAIAHAAAKTDEPVREGAVAMIGPFIDTHLICTMTSLAILITGAHLDPDLAGKGALITAKAFASIHEVFPILLTIASAVFAYSTIISWSYYGERAWEYLFRNPKSVVYYKLIYIFIIIAGPIISLRNVIDFSDLMILAMAFPNIIGMMFLSKKIVPMIKDYIARLQTGEMKTYK